MSSGTLRLPPVYVVDILKPGFTQPKKQLIYLFHGRGHLYLLFTHPIKDEWRVFIFMNKAFSVFRTKKMGEWTYKQDLVKLLHFIKIPRYLSK